MEGKKEAKISQKFNLWYIFITATMLLGAILIVNIILTFNLSNDLKKDAEITSEKLKPAKIELTLIKNSKCSDCFDSSPITSYIKNANVNVTKEEMFEFDSKEGRDIISKYKLTKIPSIIITGELDKIDIQGLEKRENVLLFADPQPPYTNAATGKIEGKVTLYVLKDPECTKCSDLSNLILQIKGAGVKIYEEKIFAPNSAEGKEFIKKYNIEFVPALILSKDAAAYSVMQQAWPQIGSKEDDGSYVLRLPTPPFINLTTNKLRGIVNIIYLTDKSCIECYDVNQHREIITSPQTFSVKLDKEEIFDISDDKGKELVAKYNITLVPTVILSSEIDVYPANNIFRQFFSVEKDGAYVFRTTKDMGDYKDLTTNQIVQAPQQQSQEQ